MKHLSTRILGSGVYLPRTRVSASDLDAQLEVAPGTTLARNGVAERYFADASETTSWMSSVAIRRALESAALSVDDLDAILFSGVMSEQPMPATAVLIHRELGARLEGFTCFDLNASCTGFLRGLETAAAQVQAGLWRRCAVVAAELASKGLHWEDLDTATLFGDGAAAVIVGPAEQSGSAILDTRTTTLSQGAALCEMRAGGSRYNVRTPPEIFTDYLFAMNGRGLLRMVQSQFPAFLEPFLVAEPTVIVPHQASEVGLKLLRRQVGERAIPCIDVLARYGNQVSASLPTALHCAIESGQLRRGDTALLIATGAGVTMSGMLLRY